MVEVTNEMIDAWKLQHKKVYRVRFEDLEVYYRTLTVADSEKLTQKAAMNLTTFNHERETFNVCVLNEIDPEILSLKSGVVPVVAEQIMIKSGYQQVESEEL